MENREYTRFETQDNAYAALRGQRTKVGKIVDISLNGLAFRYLAGEKSGEEHKKVDIFLSENGFHLPDVACTIVYDVEDASEGSLGITLYRCGLTYGSLGEESQGKLEHFIDNYTTGPA